MSLLDFPNARLQNNHMQAHVKKITAFVYLVSKELYKFVVNFTPPTNILSLNKKRNS